MDFFNSAQKLAGSWPTQVLTDAYNSGQKIDFAPILANQQVQAQQAATNFQNIVGNAQFPGISSFGPQGAGDNRPSLVSAIFPKTAKVKSPKQLAVAGKKGKDAKGKESRRKWSPNRKAAGFWSPFNDWWRMEFEKLNRRPTTEEVSAWYNTNADKAWPGDKPSVKETRRHAKCLRTTEDVRNYFRKYRAKRSIAQTKKGPSASKVHGIADPKAAFSVTPGGIPDSRGLNAAAWIQPGGNSFFNSGNIGGFTTQNDMVAAMYRNYQVQAQAAQAQAAQAQAQAIMQNTNLMYMQNANNGRKLANARDVQYVRPKREATETPPSSAETTEVVERQTVSHHLEAHTENACLSSMIGIIEKSRSLTNTPQPIPWRHEEVSTAFQDDNHLENIKLDYAPHTHSIHILPAAVVDSAESNDEHYIDGL